MQIRELLSDDDAVSPVIGVILMVAITVILAAVIASFVMGMGQNSMKTQPKASFNFDYDSSASEVTITHNSGDTLDMSKIYIRGDPGDGSALTGSGINNDGSWAGGSSGSEISSGHSADVDVVNEQWELRVVWQGAEDSATLSDDTGSNA